MSFGGFGRPGGFGTSSTSTPFGSTTPAFGAPAPAAPAFGAAGSTFGAPQQPASSGFSFGAQPSATPAFGQSQPQGGFGAAPAPAFGAQAQGGFGATPAPSFGGFGASTSAAPAFGSTNAFNSTPAKPPAFGGFGSSFGTPAQPPAGGGLFSQPQQQAGGLFGQQPQQQQGQPGDWWPEFNDIFMKDHPADQDDTRVGWIRVPNGSQNLFPQDGTGATELFDPKNPREYKDPVGDEGKFMPGALRQERQRLAPTVAPQEWDTVKKKIEARKATPLRYHAITAVEPFRNASFEELRLRDYEQNRRVPTQQKPQIKLELYGPHSPDPPGQASSTPFGGSTFAPQAPANNFFGGGATQPGFGQPQQPAANPFGASTTQNTFGQPQPSSTLFGAQPSTTPFGQTQQPTTGLFGAQPTPFGQTATSAPGMFGGTTATGFGTSTSTATPFSAAPASFGQTQPGAFGGFGAKPVAPNPFGAPQPATTSAPLGGFGLPPASSQPTPFGSAASFGQSTTAPTFGGFGQPQQAQQPAAQPFGASTTQPFGAVPAQPFGASTGGFNFGKTAPASTTGFGQPQQTTQAPALNFGGFGSTSTNKATFAPLGQSTSTGFGLGGGFGGGLGGSTLGTQPFGSSFNQQQPQQQLMASIDQNAYGQSPLFSAQPGAPAPEAPFKVIEKAKPPLTLPVRGTPRSGSALNRLRGYGTPTSSAPATGTLSWSSSPSSTSRGSPLSSLPALGDGTTPVSPHAFIGRSSVKKLVIERKASESPAKSLSSTPGRLRFDPDAELAGIEGTPSRATPTPEITASESVPRAGSAAPRQSVDGNRRASGGSGRPAPYVLDPPIEELRNYAPDQLKKVERFSVSRPGVGEIRWQEPVDLSEIGSLEQIGGGIVRIESRKASVYASDEYLGAKPPEGEGLNKPAKVTLFDIYPINLADRQPIKERGISEDLDARIDDFARKLTQYNVKRPSVESATYEHAEGKWSFRVRHFSGYGLDDDDELIDARIGGDMEVDDEAPSPPARGRRNAARRRTPSSDGQMVPDDDDAEDSDDGTYDDEDSEGPPPPRDDDAGRDSSIDRDHAEVRQAVPSSQHSDRSSSSPAPATVPSRSRHLGWTAGREPGREELMRGTLFTQPKSRPSTYASTPKRFIMPVAVDDDDEERHIAHTDITPHVYKRQILDKSIEQDQQGSFVDAGLALGRSFRVSFGPDGQVVRPSRTRGDTALVIEQPLASSYGNTVVYDELLGVHLDHTGIASAEPTSDDESAEAAPTAVVEATLRFRQLAAKELSPQSSVLKLASALFDDVDLQLPSYAPRDHQAHVEGLLRQRELSRWLESDVRVAADEDARSADGAAARIFAHLSAHRIEEACDVAIESGNLRLATLLAQAGSGDLEVRQDIALQLDRWHEQRVDAHIEPALRKVYELLAGNVGESESTQGDAIDSSPALFIPADLDWKRVFGLHLWYASPTPSREYAFPSYASAIASDARAARPIPRWALESGASVQAVNDAAYELLQLATAEYPLETALASQGFTASPIDVRLPWHAAVILERSLRKRIFEDAQAASDDTMATTSATADGLTSAFALQLEVVGKWPWAVFVLMHLSSPISRATGIKEILARNVASLDNEQYTDFVVQRLGVPAAWLHEAQALYAHYKGNLWHEMHLMASANRLEDAHRIAVSAIAPEAVLADDVALLVHLFSPYESSNNIAGWSDGGGLFLDYARSLDSADADPDFLRRVAPRLLAALPPLVASRGKHDLRARACYSTMLARISRLATAADEGTKTLASVELTALRGDDRLRWLGDATATAFRASLEVACA